MDTGTGGRIWFALTALVVAVGVVVQLVAAAGATGTFFTGPPAVLNVFTSFTIQSNLILGLGCVLLAVGAGRPTLLLRVLRLTGVVGITLTFVVFQTALRGLQDLTGQAALADVLLHTVSPVLGVVGWLWFGPRPLIDRTVVAWTAGYAAAWCVFTMARGAVVRHGGAPFYPYPFMDAADKGYRRVVVNLAVVGLVFVALSLGAAALDGRLARRRGASPRR